MLKRKTIRRKPIIFDYRSLNPFGSLRNDECNCGKREKDEGLKEENEWRAEYEMIYRSHQLER